MFWLFDCCGSIFEALCKSRSAGRLLRIEHVGSPIRLSTLFLFHSLPVYSSLPFFRTTLGVASTPPPQCLIFGAVTQAYGYPDPFLSPEPRWKTHWPWDNSLAVLILDEPYADSRDQLRSSRTTRNAQHDAPSRNRAGAFDYDPTDGLPVRKYVLETVKINQDASLDPADAANKSTANQTDDFPWPELPLPSFIDSLPPYSQELLRRARQGDRDAKPTVWDKKKQEWVRADKAKSRGLCMDALKSRHLMNVDLDQENEDDDEDGEEGSGDDEFGITGGAPAGKKRKVATGFEERIVEIKKWVQVPLDKADKMPEPKYLADRRPGMGSLYTPAYLKSITAYGAGPEGAGVQAAGFDLGDGGGLGNALGGTAPAASGEATPRKNMPPKRKKKKLGGPGRRKAVPVVVTTAGESAGGEVKEGDTSEKTATGEDGMEKKEGEEGADDGEEGSGDESEEEGSEEGEVNEEDAAPAPASPATASVDLVAAAIPLVTVEEAEATQEAVELKEPVEVVTEEVVPVEPNEVVEAVKEAQGDVTIDLLGSVEAALEEEKTE
jgi:hypothetical protein